MPGHQRRRVQHSREDCRLAAQEHDELERARVSLPVARLHARDRGHVGADHGTRRRHPRLPQEVHPRREQVARLHSEAEETARQRPGGDRCAQVYGAENDRSRCRGRSR